MANIQDLDSVHNMGSLVSRVSGFVVSLLGTTYPPMSENSTSQDL